MALSDAHVLVLRALGLGDFLTGVPALRAVARALPGHRLVLACPKELEPLVRLAGLDAAVLPTSGLEPVKWEGPRPSLAVNLHGRGPESHRLLQALAPDRLVAFESSEAGVPGPEWRAEEHEVRRWCRLVGAAGWGCDEHDLHLSLPERSPVVDGAVIVHPGAAYEARRWPPSRFGEVARWLSDGSGTVVVTGGASERQLAERVAAEAGLPRANVLAGETDLLGLAALVAHARLVVCGDTGVAHLASAFATPSVVLFGPVAPALWGPPRTGPHTVLWHGSARGSPWAEEPDPALLRISVAEVIEAAGARLESSAGSGVTGAVARSS